MIVTNVHIVGTLLLAELEAVARQQELFNGPLVDIGLAATNTALTFNMDDPAPDNALILRLTPGGVTPAVPDHTLVCQGNCLVAGQLTGVAAFRAGTKTAGALSVQPNGALEQSLLASLSAALTFKDLVLEIAGQEKVPPEIVAAIGSVESGWGTSALMIPNGPSGTGDRKPRAPDPPLRPGSMPTDGGGFGRGLMQIDWDAHEFARTGAWADPRANITYACRLLASNRDRFKANLNLSADDAIHAAVAAYNAGFGGASHVIADKGLKALFLPGRYATKVLERVGFFRDHGFTSTVTPALDTPAPTLSGPHMPVPGEGPYVATDPLTFSGQLVGDGECVAFVRAAANVPHTLTWTRGDLVKGNAVVKPGTAIATFDPNGKYGNQIDGRSHAAIYLDQTEEGLVVLDQWKRPENHPVQVRTIPFGNTSPANDGNQFFVIL